MESNKKPLPLSASLSSSIWSSLFIVWIGALFLAGCAPAIEKPKPQESCGFARNVYGERISWKGNIPVELTVDPSVPADLLPAIERAAQTWNEAAGRNLVRLVFATTHQPVARGDRRNTISFQYSWDKSRPTEQGRTNLHRSGSEIMEADILINGQDFKFYGGERSDGAPAGSVSFQALILHEIGHSFGLEHPDDKADSVMVKTLGARTDRIVLSQSDKDSLACEY